MVVGGPPVVPDEVPPVHVVAPAVAVVVEAVRSAPWASLAGVRPEIGSEIRVSRRRSPPPLLACCRSSSARPSARRRPRRRFALALEPGAAVLEAPPAERRARRREPVRWPCGARRLRRTGPRGGARARRRSGSRPTAAGRPPAAVHRGGASPGSAPRATAGGAALAPARARTETDEDLVAEHVRSLTGDGAARWRARVPRAGRSDGQGEDERREYRGAADSDRGAASPRASAALGGSGHRRETPEVLSLCRPGVVSTSVRARTAR